MLKHRHLLSSILIALHSPTPWALLYVWKICSLQPFVPSLLSKLCSYSSISFHGVTECPGLRGSLKLISFQPSCHEQGHFPPDLVAQGLIQPGLEHCQGHGTSTISPETLFQCLTTLTVLNFFLISNLNLLSFSWKPFPLFCHYMLF